MRVGTVCYAVEQGIGYLAKWFYDNGIVTDVLVVDRANLEDRRPLRLDWFPGADVASSRYGSLHHQIAQKGRELIDRVDAMLFIETPFVYSLYDDCRRRGIRSVLVPMYEGYPVHPQAEPDVFACPSLLDQDIFRERCVICANGGKVDVTTHRDSGERRYLDCNRHPFIPIPVERRWEQRTTAKRWLHNGGHLGLRGHKGTLELLRAMEHVKTDVDLTVRAQDVAGLERIMGQVADKALDQVKFSRGSVPHERLFDGFDALIQPEKYNGLSLPLQEARAAGMLVVTSDRYPHNTWLPTCFDRTGERTLIPVKGYSKQRVAGSCLEYDEAELDPRDIAATIDRLNGADIAEYSRGGRQWAEAMSWANLQPLWMEVLK